MFAFIKAVMIYHRILSAGIELDSASMEMSKEGAVVFTFSKGLGNQVRLRVQDGLMLSEVADSRGVVIGSGTVGEVADIIIARFR
jgi:hypothetical protein